MPFLDKVFKEKPKSVQEVVQKAAAGFEALSPLITEDGLSTDPKHAKAKEKAFESIAKYLAYMKLFLFGDEDQEPKKENVIALAEESCRYNLLPQLVKYLEYLDFEVRKDAAAVFGAIVRIKDNNDRCPGAQYVQHPTHIVLLSQLFAG
jgi:calcium binding protein 39